MPAAAVSSAGDAASAVGASAAPFAACRSMRPTSDQPRRRCKLDVSAALAAMRYGRAVSCSWNADLCSWRGVRDVVIQLACDRRLRVLALDAVGATTPELRCITRLLQALQPSIWRLAGGLRIRYHLMVNVRILCSLSTLPCPRIMHLTEGQHSRMQQVRGSNCGGFHTPWSWPGSLSPPLALLPRWALPLCCRRCRWRWQVLRRVLNRQRMMRCPAACCPTSART